MLIISRTPVRISFFGGGTDYPAFYQENPGAVLGTTIDQYTYISVKTLQSSFFDHSIRVAYSKTELVSRREEIQHPSVRESLKFKEIEGNLDIHIFSDLPARTGLGSSSSFTVGFLNALYALQGKKVSKQRLAEEACHVEQNLIQENVGSQDQFHAAFGGFNVIEFGPSSTQVRPVVLSREKKEVLQDHLLIFFTGMTRFASEIVKEQVDKTKTRQNDLFLKEMHEMVYAAEEMMVSSSADQMARMFGELLHESWELKKRLSSKISNPALDDAYAAAKKAGAYGGKLCGAGSGGFLAFIVPPPLQSKVREALKGMQEVSFRFENEGSTIIYMKD
jgi:D-glycero-alpha-D-manno-heptose-7-phosphate kinase